MFAFCSNLICFLALGNYDRAENGGKKAAGLTELAKTISRTFPSHSRLQFVPRILHALRPARTRAINRTIKSSPGNAEFRVLCYFCVTNEQWPRKSPLSRVCPRKNLLDENENNVCDSVLRIVVVQESRCRIFPLFTFHR